ncbi:MAG: hypothetical protein WC365_02785 [Candidatus Babeliales bacterium]|jgi:hypothetical protein
MKRTGKKLALLGVLVVGSASATEMRTPWIAERGPIRYTFEKLHNDQKCNFNYWTALHAKEANSAFIKHGTKKHPLSALIFNKADFTLNEIFPNSHIDMNSENYSPWLNLVTVHPRVEYWEWGITTGGRFDCEVWKGKGRIGMRATVPFRSIEMERKDVDDDYEDPEEDFVASNIFEVQDGSQVVVKAYNMALVAGLPNDADRNKALVLGPQSAVFSTGNLSVNLENDVDGDRTIYRGGNIQPIAGVIYSEQLPVERRLAFDMSRIEPAGPLITAASKAERQSMNVTADGAVQHVNFTNADAITQLTDIGFFNSNNVPGTTGSAVDYTNLGNNQTELLNLWLILARDQNAVGEKFFGDAETVARAIEDRLQMYQEDPIKFFARQGYEMQTNKRRQLGDIDVDLFYEHTFNKEWIGELFVGTRIPTGSTKNQFGNPYNVMSGNGEHWEVKLGAMIAYQPAEWINMKLDAYYSFVIEATEHRMAAFQGAQIKNFGPRADADVDWGYFVGRFDFNFFHPKNSDIRTVFGYEFYYKTEDHLTYKRSTMESFAGEHLIEVTPATDPKTYQWAHDYRSLDNKLARTNTESISHKLRSEISYQVSTYFELYASASSTFAGKGVMRDSDYQGGFVVRF